MSFSEPDLDAYIRERLHEALADLSVDDISLLQLHYCEGRTVAQIAELLGGTSDAAEMNLQRARAEVEKRMNIPVDRLQGWSFDEVLTQAWPKPSEMEVEASGRRVWFGIQKELKTYDTQFRSLYRNDWADAHGLRDLQVLAAIGLLGGESSFENISAIVNEWSSIDVESRFVYAAMDRLQDRKLITSHFSDVAKTGNAPKRLFKITPDGQRKLSTAPKQALARVKNDEWDQTDDSAWRAPL